MIDDLYNRVKLPFPDDKIEFYSDGNDDYTYVLQEFYAETCMDYGQLIKIREKGRVVDKEKRIIYGNTEPDSIETTNVENYNGILRERIGRLVRKTKCFSKRKYHLECAIHVFQFYWDFINEFKRGATPAMLEGIDVQPWSWDDFLLYHYAV